MAGIRNFLYLRASPNRQPLCRKVPPIFAFYAPFTAEISAMNNHARPENSHPTHIATSLLFLIAKHSHHGCTRPPHLIAEHLNFLQQHESKRVMPMLRQTCSGLVDQWRAFIDWLNKQRAAEPAKQIQKTASGRLH